jgi:hypothetical protein
MSDAHVFALPVDYASNEVIKFFFIGKNNVSP